MGRVNGFHLKKYRFNTSDLDDKIDTTATEQGDLEESKASLLSLLNECYQDSCCPKIDNSSAVFLSQQSLSKGLSLSQSSADNQASAKEDMHLSIDVTPSPSHEYSMYFEGHVSSTPEIQSGFFPEFPSIDLSPVGDGTPATHSRKRSKTSTSPSKRN